MLAKEQIVFFYQQRMFTYFLTLSTKINWKYYFWCLAEYKDLCSHIDKVHRNKSFHHKSMLRIIAIEITWALDVAKTNYAIIWLDLFHYHGSVTIFFMQKTHLRKHTEYERIPRRSVVEHNSNFLQQLEEISALKLPNNIFSVYDTWCVSDMSHGAIFATFLCKRSCICWSPLLKKLRMRYNGSESQYLLPNFVITKFYRKWTDCMNAVVDDNRCTTRSRSTKFAFKFVWCYTLQ